jgi:TctA family transporter
MPEGLIQAAGDIAGRPDLWLILFAAACYGIFVGTIPGLTATMAVALFVPVAYWLDPLAAITAIVAIVACAIFAGDLPTVYLRIPGTPASAAYADQAYRLHQRGLGGRVLGVSLLCSVTGGILGAIVLMLLGGQLANVARWFSVTEYLWLYVIGLSCAVLVSPGTARWKALVSLLIGWLLASVGWSAVHGVPRFAFGYAPLYQGISFIPAMIGLFGLSEVFANLSRDALDGQADQPASSETEAVGEAANADGTVTGPWRDFVWRLKHRPGGIARSSGLGVLIGMLPGAGADIASWVSFAMGKRRGDDPDSDTVQAIGDATTANSSALAGGWIPALVFGIPGDSVTAIVIGVLLMKNVTPGPAIFEDQSALVYSIYLVFLCANLVMLPVGAIAIAFAGRLVRIPKRVLLPVIVLFCVTGAYALNASLFDVVVMTAMGLAGFLLNRFGFPLGPVVLGLILGSPLEERLVQALTASGGRLTGLVDRPIAAVLACVAAAVWLRIFQVMIRESRAAKWSNG